MGHLHFLIVIPYYFIGALLALPLLMVICRILRLRTSINTLVGGAIGLAVAMIVVPLACDWVDLVSFTGRPLLLMVVASLLLAGVDVALAQRLPLPLDDELREL